MVRLMPLSLIAILGLAVSIGRADSILDGGFEVPVEKSGAYQLFSPGQSIPSATNDWSVVGAAGNVAVISGDYVYPDPAHPNITFPAQEGTQWLDLTGLSNTATGVQQSVPTTIGQTYTLSFWVGNVNSPDLFGSNSTVDVFIDNAPVPVLIAENSSTNATTLVWEQFSHSFVATSSSTTIEFLNGDPSTDNSNGLDNVTLTATTPLPSVAASGALLLSVLGAGALGSRRLSRHK